MDLSLLKANLKSLETQLIIAKQNRANINKDIKDYSSKITLLSTESDTLEKAITIFIQAAATSRDNARSHFETIITDALQFVTQSKDYEFVIQEIPGRAKASYEFFIKSTVNGIECIQKPEDSNGGGFVDIISTACKYAYREIFKDPCIQCDTLFYDEPGKMISEQMSIKFAEYIKFLGKHYGRQTVMVTHNDSLSNVGNITYYVSKDKNGISSVVDNAIMAIGIDPEVMDAEIKVMEEEIEEELHVH